jgi:hypothetical protein
MVGFEMKGKAAADKARAPGDQNAFWKGSLHSSDTEVVEFKCRRGAQNRIGGGNVPHVNNVSQRFIFDLGQSAGKGIIATRNKTALPDLPV